MLSLFLLLLLHLLSAATALLRPSCSAREFGARGDGRTLDTRAINQAVQECAETVLCGGVFLSGSVQLLSNRTFRICGNATLLGAGSGNYSHYLPNPWKEWQDFGHNHWRNALLWADNAVNIRITGGGTVDDGPSLHEEGPIPQGSADKLIGLKQYWTEKLSARDHRLSRDATDGSFCSFGNRH